MIAGRENLSKKKIKEIAPDIESAREFLLSFKRALGVFSWHPHNHKAKKARSLRYFIVPSDLAAAISEEPLNILAEKRRTPRAEPKFYPEHPARSAFEYLNSLPIHPFNEILKNLPRAIEEIRRMEAPANEKLKQCLYLAQIARNPKPIYSPSRTGRTTRIFESGGLQTLHSPIRRVLCPDWHELDLKNAHLAIAARDWDIPSIQSFLESGRSIWDKIFEDLRISPDEQKKRAIKDCLYSLMYGIHAPNAKGALTQKLDKELSQRFFQIDLISDLIAARDRRISEIKDAGRARDCFGKWLQISKDQPAKSILSQLAQARETRLILPIYDLASRTDDFQILLHQHDGISVKIRKGREEQVLRRIDVAVNSEIVRGGYQTTLELKRPLSTLI